MPTMLIAARALQGVGAAAMLPNSLALLNRAYGHDPKLRARAVGLWTAAGAVSIAAGPVAGGLLIAAFGWRSIFLVNLPICAAGLLATWLWVPRDEATGHAQARNGKAGIAGPADSAAADISRAASGTVKQASATERGAPPATSNVGPRGIDLGGQCLAIVALTAFVAAVIEWRPLGLGHPLVAGGFVLALLAAGAFIAVESRSASPMLPLSLFSKRTFSAAVLFGICVNLTYYGMVFVLSLYLQRVRGYSPLQAGLAFLPLTGGFLVSNVASGWAVGRFGVRVPMIVGAVIAALGYGLLHRVDAATPLSALLLPFLLIPSGMGLAVPAMTTAVLASTEAKRAGTASAVLNTARQAGGAVGVAAFGALASGAARADRVGHAGRDGYLGGTCWCWERCWAAWCIRSRMRRRKVRVRMKVRARPPVRPTERGWNRVRRTGCGPQPALLHLAITRTKTRAKTKKQPPRCFRKAGVSFQTRLRPLICETRRSHAHTTASLPESCRCRSRVRSVRRSALSQCASAINFSGSSISALMRQESPTHQESPVSSPNRPD